MKVSDQCAKCGHYDVILFAFITGQYFNMCLDCRNEAIDWLYGTPEYARWRAVDIRRNTLVARDEEVANTIAKDLCKYERSMRMKLNTWMKDNG